jgi:hypothetical protein
MPINWTKAVEDAITDLETKKPDRVLDPVRSLSIIDDVVEGMLTAAEIAALHGITQEWIRATLGHITRAVGTGGLRSLAAGGWYELKSKDQPYDVAPGFAAAWKKARGLS